MPETIKNCLKRQVFAVRHRQLPLSNDPDKNCSIFYCCAAIRFPHVETVVFSDQELINRWKAGL